MTMNDPLAAVLSKTFNAEKIGKDEVIVSNNSKLIRGVLQIFQDHGYLGTFDVIDESKGGVLKINLLGKLNGCGVVKPRFAVTKENYEKFEKRYLPAKNFGFLIVSTSKGLMVQDEAKKQELGGKLVAYCY